MRRYYELFTDVSTRRSMSAALLGSQPIIMAPLALILIGYTQYRSFAAAGALAGGHVLAAALAPGGQLRLARRLGVRTVVLGGMVSYLLAMAALLTALRIDMPIWVTIVLAAGAGTVLPTVAVTLRLVAANVESTVFELIAVVAPLLVAALSTLGTPQFSLAVTTLVAAAGTAVLTLDKRLSARARQPESGGPPARPIAVAVLATSVTGLFFGLGAVGIGLAAFAGGGAGTGVLIALWSGGAVLGSLLRWKAAGHLLSAYRWALIAVAVGHVPLILAAKTVTLGVLLLVAGASSAPVLAFGAALLREATGASVTAHAWTIAAGAAGLAGGAVAGGFLVDGAAEPNSVIGIGAASPAIGLVMATLVQWALTLVLAPAGRHRQT